MNTEAEAGQGSVEDSRQKLARDLKAVASDAEAILREAAGSAADELAAARATAAAKLDDARVALAQQVRRSAGCGHEYVSANPWRVMAVAAAAGLVAGLLLSRR